VVTTPLLLLALSLTAMYRGPKSKTLIVGLIGTDIIMILSGLVADLSGEPMRFVWFTFGCMSFLVILYLIWGPLHTIAKSRGPEHRRSFVQLATFLTVLWVIYPTTWLIGPSGLGWVGSTTDWVLFTVTPFFSKVVFSLLDISIRAGCRKTRCSRRSVRPRNPSSARASKLGKESRRSMKASVRRLPRPASSATTGHPRVAPAEARLVPYLVAVPWAAALAALVATFVSPHVVHTYALYPLLLGTVVLGLPHGALDHLLPARLNLPWGHKPLAVGGYLALYVALAGAFFALWFLAPRAAFGCFLLLTVAHWGHGDLRFTERFWGLNPTPWGAWTTALVRGALPIAVPVLAFPDTAQSLYHHAAVGLGVVPTALELASPRLHGLLFGLLAVALIAYVISTVRAAPSRVVLTGDLLELGLLIGLFTFVPAYFAVGVYFIFWHSFRHLARLLILDPEDARSVAEGDWGRPLYRLTLDALPITVVALAILGGLYLFAAVRVATLEGFVALYLVLISALTLPHAVVVALMDVWTPEEAAP